MDDIAVPMLLGNMEDIVAADPSQSSSSGQDSTNTQQTEREAR